MRTDEASRTAERVAQRRATHQILDVPPVFVDPLACRILPPEVADQIGEREGSPVSRTSERFSRFAAASRRTPSRTP